MREGVVAIAVGEVTMTAAAEAAEAVTAIYGDRRNDRVRARRIGLLSPYDEREYVSNHAHELRRRTILMFLTNFDAINQSIQSINLYIIQLFK